MKNRFWLICCLAFTMLFVSSPVFALNKEGVANGVSTVMKIGIVVLVALLVAVTAVFAYGMFINRNK